MSAQGTLSLDEGVISVVAHAASHIEAAVAGTTAGLELTVAEANVYVGRQNDRRPGVTLSVAMSDATLLQVATAVLDALGTPAFTQDEWLDIAKALTTFGTYDANPTTIAPERLRALGERIEAAYS